MTEPRKINLNIYQGGGHFEFSSEKHWGVEHNDCKIFDSIDIVHLADSIASVAFDVRHNIPAELFTIEQLEEFEVEASLALSRHTFQCNTKLKNKTSLSKSIGYNSAKAPETKLMKLILNNLSSPEENNVDLDSESKPITQLDSILGNMKPLINLLQDETNTANIKETTKTYNKPIENQTSSIPIIDSEVEVINHDAGHWLDSMLEDSDE